MKFEYSIADTRRRGLGQILADAADSHADRPALSWHGTDVISFTQLDDLASRLASGLAARGIERGDRVGVVSWNRPEVVWLQFGLARLGAVMVTVNAHARGLQLQHILSNARLRAIVIDPELREVVDEALHACARPRPILIVLPPLEGAHSALSSPDWAALLDAPAQAPTPVPNTDLLQILYTSGTTGPSKGVMITHNQMYAFADYIAHAMELSSSDVYYTCLPLFHVNAQLTILASLLRGATAALYDRFHATTFWTELSDSSATAFSLFGAMAYILYKQPPQGPMDLPPRTCWAFPAPYDILPDFEERFNVRILTAYGSTEANFPAITTVRDERRPFGSVGRVHPRFEVQVVDEDDLPSPAGVTGEIVTRPRDPFTMMLGYFDMPEATAAAFRNLWYHTGDAGYFDAEGYLYFVDRIKDVIRRRGENVSSYEVEQVVNSHPDVLESAAVAVPSELSEDEIKICVVPRTENLEPSELIDWCEQRMARFMIPRYVHVLPELPKTPSGKVEKHKLRADETGSIWDRESAPRKDTA